MGVTEWVVIGTFIAGIVFGILAWMINVIKHAIERLFDNIDERISSVTTDMTTAFRDIQKEISINTKRITNVEKEVAILQAEHKMNHKDNRGTVNG